MSETTSNNDTYYENGRNSVEGLDRFYWTTAKRTFSVNHNSQSGKTTKQCVCPLIGVNTIEVSTSCGASHYGGITAWKLYSLVDGSTGTSRTDVSDYDLVIFTIDCNGRDNPGFSQNGKTTCTITKID